MCGAVCGRAARMQPASATLDDRPLSPHPSRHHIARRERERERYGPVLLTYCLPISAFRHHEYISLSLSLASRDKITNLYLSGFRAFFVAFFGLRLVYRVLAACLVFLKQLGRGAVGAARRARRSPLLSSEKTTVFSKMI